MCRIGDIVLNPFLGPRFKASVVTTDLPLAVDKPIDFGLQDFCSKCGKCARYCPTGSISFGEKVIYNGYEKWPNDVEKCTRGRVGNTKGSGCGVCVAVCPWNKPYTPFHRFIQWTMRNIPAPAGSRSGGMILWATVSRIPRTSGGWTWRRWTENSRFPHRPDSAGTTGLDSPHLNTLGLEIHCRFVAAVHLARSASAQPSRSCRIWSSSVDLPFPLTCELSATFWKAPCASATDAGEPCSGG